MKREQELDCILRWGCGWARMLRGSCHFLCRSRRGTCSQSKKAAGICWLQLGSSFLLWLLYVYLQDGDLSLVLNYKYMWLGSTIAPETHTRCIRAEEAARSEEGEQTRGVEESLRLDPGKKPGNEWLTHPSPQDPGSLNTVAPGASQLL